MLPHHHHHETVDMDDTSDTNDATSLAPPPLKEYNTKEAAERFLRHWAINHGYALTRKTLKKDSDSLIHRWDFRCAKGGVQRG